ncbi:MAG: alpha/beta hydrolase [Anaerolineae bacterium]|nr:alpha/beta hydrolase [Anaerolineae bacterium]
MAQWQDYLADKAEGAHTVVGTLKVLPGFWSPQLRNRRDLLVYLPPSYSRSNKRYPVIYMHDGQNLFDQFTSFAGEWQVDETMEALSRRGYEAIIVGLPNQGEHRLDEYSPFPQPRYSIGQGAKYVEFILQTVKPLIDRDFRTLPERVHTGIFGSSMGGLISLYAFFCPPQAFGLAGVMSPSLWFAQGRIFSYVEHAPFVPGKIYLDTGTHEQTSFYTPRAQLRTKLSPYYSTVHGLYDLLYHKGYRPGQDLLYVEEENGLHNEAAWARRLPAALEFLLGQ